jgi:hypothetical protein
MRASTVSAKRARIVSVDDLATKVIAFINDDGKRGLFAGEVPMRTQAYPCRRDVA